MPAIEHLSTVKMLCNYLLLQTNMRTIPQSPESAIHIPHWNDQLFYG